MQNQTSKRREPKKTVSIEVRVSDEEKRAFVDACQTSDRSVSAVLRRLMEGFVAFQSIRSRTFSMMKRFLQSPARAAIASIGSVAAVSMALILAPTASAEMRLAYQVFVDDGVGQIVSMGELDFASDGSVGDSLGDRVRFQLTAAPCQSDDGSACAGRDRQLVLSLWDYREGELVTETDQGIHLPESGETRYETAMGDGRTLVVLLAPQVQG